MAFPTIVSTATYNGDTLTVTHNVTLPASIVSGNLLVMVSIGPGNTTTPTGWTAIGPAASSGAAVFTRTADGLEGATVAVTMSGSSRASAITYQVSDWTAIEIANVDAVDPPLLTPTFGGGDTLWIAAMVARRSDWSATAPTSYGTLLSAGSASSTATTRKKMYTAHRTLNATSEDPATFTVTGTADTPVAITIGIQAAAASAPTASGSIAVSGSATGSTGSTGGVASGTVSVSGSAVAAEPNVPTQAAVIVSTTTYNRPTSTAHDVTLPLALDIGDTLVMIARSPASVFSTLVGWVVEAYQGGNGEMYVWSRVVDGSESEFVALTTTDSTIVTAVIYHISGARAVEAAIIDTDNPPLLAPTFGSSKTVWITALTGKSADWTATAPAGYGDLIRIAETSGSAATSRSTTVVASRTLEASSEDPGLFSITTGTPSVMFAATIGVQGSLVPPTTASANGVIGVTGFALATYQGETLYKGATLVDAVYIGTDVVSAIHYGTVQVF